MLTELHKGLFGYSGLPVTTSPLATQRAQYRFPRSKKSRIRKKWAKRDSNYRQGPGMYILYGKNVVVHPEIFENLKKHL